MTNVEWKVLKSNADAERAQLNKILADIRGKLYSGTSTVGGASVTGSNVTATGNFEDRLNAMAMAWQDTTARVYELNDTITAISQDVTYLSARIDDVEAVGTGMSETIQLLTARVDSNEDGIIANSGFITDLSTAVNNPTTGLSTKASNTRVSAAESRLDTVEGVAQSSASELLTLTASVGDAVASINEVREVAVSAASGNALVNPSFETDDGWRFTSDNVLFFAHANAATGQRVLRLNPGGGNAAALLLQPVKTGQTIRLGGKVRPVGDIPNAGARLRLQVNRYNSAGDYINTSLVAYFPRPAAYEWVPFDTSYVIPDGTSFVSYIVGSEDLTSGALAVDDVYLEPSSNTLAEMMAKYTLAVQAGGDVAGMQLLAGGGISAIRFLANMFSIVNPAGTNGWEFDGGMGRQTTRGGGYMKVEGAPFGPGNQFLWGIWPEMNLNQLSTSNAKIAVDVNGAVIVNGAFITGQIKNATQGTLNNTTDYIELGPYATVGNNKQLTASLFSRVQVSNSGSGSLVVEGSRTLSIRLQRAIGSGSFSTVGTGTVTLTWSNVENEPGQGLTAVASGAGNITYTDTHSSLEDRRYRMQITSGSGTMRYRIASGSWINLGDFGQASLLSLENP